MAAVADDLAPSCDTFVSTVLPDKAQMRMMPALSNLDDEFHKAHFCRPFCNWVVPGMLMVGTNPMWGFMTSPRERMSRILNEGVTVFYALQREVPEQECMRDRGSHDENPGLADETPYRPLALALAQEKGISSPLLFRRFGIEDMGTPDSPADVLPVVAELQQLLKEGKKVYLHCRGGVGRAGTIASCLLVYMYGIPADAALERIQKAYDTRGGIGDPQSCKTSEPFGKRKTASCRCSPETQDQRKFVQDFARKLESGELQP